MVTKTQAISAFLLARTHQDLASMYNANMEAQVNVATDNGERIEGEYNGRHWHGFQNPNTGEVWKSFRIPWNANSTPSFTDSEMRFSLEDHAEGIGMTGWDWVDKVSRWVAFDFDAITGHSDKHTSKLSSQELDNVRKAASELPWVSVRYSTSGKGLHLYVLLDAVPTSNHTEHAALARSILGLMSAHSGFDFKSKVDVCGGNMWVWHRKMLNTNGLDLIKQGSVLNEPPINWRDHINVCNNKQRKTRPSFLQSNDSTSLSSNNEDFDELSGKRPIVKLDEVHLKLIKHLEDSGSSFWWDQDHHMLVAHTFDLQIAHAELGFKGIFKTTSTGKNKGTDHNCFLFPMRRGAWSVRRYTKGIAEEKNWDQDGEGWTRCYLNREPDLQVAARSFGGVEHPTRGFVFRHGEQAQECLLTLGATLSMPPHMAGRSTAIKLNKDGRLIVEIPKENTDQPELMKDWVDEKGKKWIRIVETNKTENNESDVSNYDDILRHVVSGDFSDRGWCIKCDGQWSTEPLTHVGHALSYLGLKPTEAKAVLGSNVFRPWKIVNFPFQLEYPGDRQWNREAAQLRFVPSLTDVERLKFPAWNLILDHVGESLNQAVRDDSWCRSNNLKKGSDYLKCWIASVIQNPYEPLPYLFLHGPQNSGKSILHEAFGLLMTGGLVRADNSLTNPSSFNAELENMVICIVEETNLNKNGTAYNRIKDWVTTREISIHRKMFTPYSVKNTTHWIQCANDISYCPVFPGDTRITMIYVPSLSADKLIPKRQLILSLEKEAPDFLASIMGIELPTSNDRLGLPVLTTESKMHAETANSTDLERFIHESCFYFPGSVIKLSAFYEEFLKFLEPSERMNWTKAKVSNSLDSSRFPKGRLSTDPNFHYGNISFTPPSDIDLLQTPLISHVGKLVPKPL